MSPARMLLLIAIAATLLPPGYPAYIGAYIALGAALLALLVYGWREWSVFAYPTSLAILAAIILVTTTVPFVYRGEPDLLGPILVLPMLSTIALGMLARPAGHTPDPVVFATICLFATFIAVLGGAYEHFVLGISRPGLGNNPIHYGSLAAMTGGLALIGVVASNSAWRYIFLLGPVFGLAAAAISDSRGPMVGAATIAGVGILILLIWLWREKLFRFSMLAILLLAGAAALLSIGSSSRIAGIFDSAFDIFRFTGGSDDIRAALYVSALEALRSSPIVGVGLGQIMQTAQTLFPEQPAILGLDNLHADWANFAAMAGGMGIFGWLLLLVSPLLLLVDPHMLQDRPIVLGAILLFVGQLTLGISNATFGVLPQTMVFAISLGYFLARGRRLTIEQS